MDGPQEIKTEQANDRQVGGKHYQTEIQHWDYVIANDIPYLEAQIMRYVGRHKKKHGLQDLYKAQHFLEKLLETEERKYKILQAAKVGTVRGPGPLGQAGE